MIATHLPNVLPALSRFAWLGGALLLIIGCTPITRPQAAPAAAAIVVPPPPSNFMIAAGELETWNAVGQILVRLHGATYKGRAQKLGLYAVDYRGEEFLVLTRALVANAEVRTLITDVRVALQDGKPNPSAAAIELLGLLQARLPAELIRIAALPKPAPAKAKIVAKKKGAKRSTRR